MMAGLPGRHRTVLVAGVPAAIAAAAASAFRPHSLLVLPALPPPEGVPALASAPDLILLGVDRAGQRSPALLDQLKQDPAYRSIPVLVGASGWTADELETHYRMQANACLEWPEDAAAEAWLGSISRFWLGGDTLLAARVKS